MSRNREKQARRALYLAERSGDTAAAERHAATLARIVEAKSGGASASSSGSASTSLATRASEAGGSIVGFYDRNRTAVLSTTVVVSAVGGTKLNQKFGVQTPFELQPSTLAGIGTLVGAGIARAFGMRRTTQMALAVSLGQGVATVGAHMPTGGLMAPKGTPKV